MKILLALLLLFSQPLFAAAAREDVEREIEGAFQRSEWTRHERYAFMLSTTAHMLDLYTSLHSDGCEEQNPLLGSHPHDASLIGVKIIAIGFEMWLYSSKQMSHYKTHWYGYTSAVIHGYIAYSNSRNRCFDG